MKTTHILLAAVLAATSAVQAAEHKLPAPLPAFKTPEQLVVWRKEMMAKAAAADALAAKQGNSAPSTSAFYTGKPFVAETASYAFMFRQYDPGLSRWTSADPSGFPDGLNNSKYAPVPTTELDYAGLWTIVSRPPAPTSSGFSFAGETITQISSGGVPQFKTVYESRTDFNGWTDSNISQAVGPNQALVSALTIGLTNTTTINVGGSNSGITIGASYSSSGSMSLTYNVNQAADPNHGWKATLLIAYGSIYNHWKEQQYDPATQAWSDVAGQAGQWSTDHYLAGGFTNNYGLMIEE
jgi:RHS repeat-associated protein